MKSLLIIIGSLFWLSCYNINPQNAKPLENSETIEILVDKFHGNKIYYSKLFENVRIVPLETNPNSLIGDIYRIKIIDNYIYILDAFSAKSLFVFTKEGKFIKKIGSVGKGPGEYLMPGDFCYDSQNKRILVVDVRTGKINIYDLNGNFKKNIHLKPSSLGSTIGMQNEYIYIDNSRLSGNTETYLLNNINESGVVQKRWFKYPEYGFFSPVQLGFDGLFQTKTDIKYNNCFINTIYSIKQNEIYPFIILKSDNMISIAELNKLKENALKKPRPILTLVDIINTGKMWGIHNYLENDKVIYLEFFNFGSRNRIIYNLRTHEIYCGVLIDDLMNSLYEFHAIDDNSLIGIIESRFDKTIEDIVVELKNKNQKIAQSELKKLDKINSSSNPILLFYELK